MVFFILVLAYHNSYPTVRFQYKADIRQRLLSSESGRSAISIELLLSAKSGHFIGASYLYLR